MREGGGPGQQRLDARVEMRVTLEIGNAHRAVEQGAGDRVLHAELGLERRLRAGIVGVRQAAAVRHDLDLRRVVSADAFLLAEREHHGDSRVGAAAAGKLLEAHGFAGDLERVGPVVEDLVEVIVAGAVEGVEEPLLVLEHGRVGVVAGFGEQGGEQAVAALSSRRTCGRSGSGSSLNSGNATSPFSISPSIASFEAVTSYAFRSTMYASAARYGTARR